jgi:hypothetical protein
VWATSDGPKIEDFGITEADLVRVPRLFVASHRPWIFVLSYLVAAVVLFLGILLAGSSWSAAAFFTIILLAAGSVLLLPMLVAALCVGERAEERWLCNRVPVLRACLAYRKAVDEHRRRKTTVSRPRPCSAEAWAALPAASFRAEVASLLEEWPHGSVTSFDREATGVDFSVPLDDSEVILRCEAGSRPVAAAVGRELVAAVADRRAVRALIVTTAGASPALSDYIAGRPVSVVTPSQLHAFITRRELPAPPA